MYKNYEKPNYSRDLGLVKKISLGRKELHYETLPKVKLGSWTGKSILDEFEKDKSRRAFFMSGLASYDNKLLWKKKKNSEEYPEEAEMAFFQRNLKQHGTEQYLIFNDSLRAISHNFLNEENYTVEDAIEDTLKVWNNKIIKVENSYYSPFELYASSWKFYEYYLPYNEKYKRVKNYSYALSYKNIEKLSFNILIHSVKWFLGDLAEVATGKMLEYSAKKCGVSHDVIFCNNQADQYKNIDLKFGETKISVKSGRTVTSQNAQKMFSHTSYTHLIGPAEMLITESITQNSKISKSNKGIGAKVFIKNVAFDNFFIMDKQGEELTIKEFLLV